MSGPDVTPGNLIGDVRFTVGGGCAKWDYGYRSSLTAGSGRAAPGLALGPHHRP